MNRSMEPTNEGCCTATERCAVVPTHAGRQRMITAVRWISSLLILAALLTIVRTLPIDQAMGAIKGWTAGLGIWGPVVLALAYIVATVLFVPGTILTLAAGGMFGLVVGTITVSIGSTLGASMAFLIARYVARDKVAARASRNRRFGAIDRAIGEGGWKIVALLRLSPAIPFNLQNYLYGLTPIRFWPYVLTSWLAMLPGTFLYVYLGHIAGAAVGADRSRTPAEWAMLAVGLLATVVVTVYVTRLARRKLQEQMNEAAEEEASPIAEEEAQRAPGNGVRLRGTIILAAVALVMAGAAVVMVANLAAIERRLESLFGPPRVELPDNQIEPEQIRPRFVNPRIFRLGMRRRRLPAAAQRSLRSGLSGTCHFFLLCFVSEQELPFQRDISRDSGYGKTVSFPSRNHSLGLGGPGKIGTTRVLSSPGGTVSETIVQFLRWVRSASKKLDSASFQSCPQLATVNFVGRDVACRC